MIIYIMTAREKIYTIIPSSDTTHSHTGRDSRTRTVTRGARQSALVEQRAREVDRAAVLVLHDRRVEPVVAVAELHEAGLAVAHRAVVD